MRRRRRDPSETIYICSGCRADVYDDVISGVVQTMSADSDKVHECTFSAIRKGTKADRPRFPTSLEVRQRVLTAVACISSQIGWTTRRAVGASIRSYPGSKVWQNEDEAEFNALRMVFAQETERSIADGVRKTSEIMAAAAAFKSQPSLERLVQFAMAINRSRYGLEAVHKIGA